MSAPQGNTNEDSRGSEAQGPWPGLSLVLVLLGTLVRLVYGCHAMLWRCAPDQAAWDLNLRYALHTGGSAYHEFIHYPHEGGSLLLSLLAIAFAPLDGWLPPLSWAALFTDTLSRYLQIRMSTRLFGWSSARWFGAWTVLSVPLILPWGTVDFGLHSLVAFVPFLFIRYAMDRDVPDRKLGVLAGLGGCLSYECLILVPAYLARSFMVGGVKKSTFGEAAGFLLGAIVGFLPHVVLRLFLDNAFSLENMPALGVRGLEQEPLRLVSAFPNLITVWISTLPASFLLSALEPLSSRMTALVVFSFLLIGVVNASRTRRSRAEWLILWVILLFSIVYAMSPLFVDRVDAKSYLPYRHFTFILPLLVLLMVVGLVRIRASAWVLGAWLALCASASLAFMMRTAPCLNGNDGATGWVLARKYGHDPERLVGMAELVQEPDREELLRGFGWGMTTTIFEHASSGDGAPMERMCHYWSRFPARYRAQLLDGVRLAFAPGVTPVLDSSLKPVLIGRLGTEEMAVGQREL